jgi:hypothetical protein
MAGIETAEREFVGRLEAFGKDARSCATLSYTWFTLDLKAGQNFEIRERFNRYPAFWNTVIGSLQASTFVALGRMFDRKRDTYNGTELLNFADTHLGIFSRQAYEARMVRIGLSPENAKVSAAKAYELRPGGLNELRRQFEQKLQFFEDKVAPIRHNVYAHAGKLTFDDRDTLFYDLQLRSLEDLVVFPLRVESALFQLYHNGRPPELDAAPSLISDVIKSAPARGEGTWEHLHTAQNVVAFLDWLRETPLGDD